ncbi:hypothetical protein [Streptomyces sp. DG1A-41]|uniref:hypothetical protein n=1 Tax=Streptomyces sp. DG1A-41 TaxID=3125779 RepID=UPI0030D1F277
MVRVDVLWTPGNEGLEVIVRDADSLESQGSYKAPELALMPIIPPAGTLHAAVRRVLLSVEERPFLVDYAYRLARRDGFRWVPEKLAKA